MVLIFCTLSKFEIILKVFHSILTETMILHSFSLVFVVQAASQPAASQQPTNQPAGQPASQPTASQPANQPISLLVDGTREHTSPAQAPGRPKTCRPYNNFLTLKLLKLKF